MLKCTGNSYAHAYMCVHTHALTSSEVGYLPDACSDVRSNSGELLFIALKHTRHLVWWIRLLLNQYSEEFNMGRQI